MKDGQCPDQHISQVTVLQVEQCEYNVCFDVGPPKVAHEDDEVEDEEVGGRSREGKEVQCEKVGEGQEGVRDHEMKDETGCHLL